MGLIKITNQYLPGVSWVNANECGFKVNDTTDVWRINISLNIALLDYFTTVLNENELVKANRYFQTKDKNRFIVSRGALRILLGQYLNYSPSAIIFGIGVNKKPYIKTPEDVNLHYNISHSGDWILIAIAASAIGADVEFVNPSFNFNDILEDNFSAAEISYIKQTSSVERFFMTWTRKEALTKATEKGLDQDLKLIPGLDGENYIDSIIAASANNWLINSFPVSDTYVASIANNLSAKKLMFWNADFNYLRNIS
ncbi:4'-phosphopantetheinyl transferase family protein [Mucilaginibacter sp.]|uniref:4'-phosphopantetheinyl transferase family protein n=1 Tax=Mucilaginibacter sp. TaxID=1882438 RepID=UPI003D1192F3